MLHLDLKNPIYTFSAQCHNLSGPVEMFKHNRFLYFRPKQFVQDWQGAICIYYGAPTAKTCERYASKYQSWLQEERFFRVFLLPDPQLGPNRIWQVWWNPKFGFTFPMDIFEKPFPASYRKEGSFFFCEFNPHLSLIHTSTSDLRAHFEREWNDPDSDVRAALPWCDIFDGERDWPSIEWQRGSREAIEAVARAVYSIADEWNRNRPLFITFVFLCRGFQEYEENKSGLQIQSSHRESRYTPGSRIKNVFDRLEECNSGTYNLTTSRRMDWFKFQESPQKPPCSNTRFVLKIDPPTQHERMEAALFLRDWLLENAPDLLADWFPEAA